MGDNGKVQPKDKKPASKGNDKAKFAIKTDKASYHEGDTVTGTVYLKATKPLQCKGVMCKFTGVTKTYWDTIDEATDAEGNVERSMGSCEGKKEFFKKKVKISDDVETIQPGSYEYRFSYELPADLPGSFYDKRKFNSVLGELTAKGETVYKVKACLDVDDAKDLKARQEFTVHQKLDEEIDDEKTKAKGKVCMFGCIPRGEIKMKSTFDKNAYCIGETAKVHTKIDNDSKVDIKDMVIKVMRFITFKSESGVRKWISETVCEKKFEGVKKDSKEERDMPITFTEDCYPVTKGPLIECTYRFDVEAQVDWAPDIEIHLPVTVYEPEQATWGTAF
eukprot:TRINITY_DN5756_c0_g1_i1.p1 TRINITY_DN5756_c0_g1~~TRINITY_DN5756_c0_g1_i1.p1  ORF type:complete len:334 (-),score=98.27 TRINITY_DN5756_c0_g1_i1:215-1216(-)